MFIKWWLLVMNVSTFVIVALEKLWWTFCSEYDRLSELFFETMTLAISSLGGALGTVLGMIIFKHWIDKKIFMVVLIGSIITSVSLILRLASSYN